MHIHNLVKIHIFTQVIVRKQNSGWTDGPDVQQTHRPTDDYGETMITGYYRVAGYKNLNENSVNKNQLFSEYMGIKISKKIFQKHKTALHSTAQA